MRKHFFTISIDLHFLERETCSVIRMARCIIADLSCDECTSCSGEPRCHTMIKMYHTLQE